MRSDGDLVTTLSALDAFLETLDAEAAAEPAFIPPPSEEIVVDTKTGEVRQAGADTTGAFVTEFKAQAERSLFTFAYGVLGRTYLTRTLHEPVCGWLTDFTKKRRKMLLMPREHAKTSIIAHALPLHMMIQPKSANIYLPDTDGRDTTIVLSGETEDRVVDAMRVIQSALEGSTVLRGLWPHVCWDNPRAQSKKWNDTEIIIRHDHRGMELPDPTIRGIGVGGAITGAHPRILIKDDLATLAAANSPTVMQSVIQWHVASRALINKPECLEFMTTTRWAAYDWARYVMENDKSVEVMLRSGIEAGEPIYPEGGFTLTKFDELKSEFGVLFPFLYLNTAVGTDITDFAMSDVRTFEFRNRELVFDEDERDLVLANRVKPAEREVARDPLAPATADNGYPGGRANYIRLKRG